MLFQGFGEIFGLAVCCCGEQSENLINCGADVPVSLVCTSCMLYVVAVVVVVVVVAVVVVRRPLTSPTDVSPAPPSLSDNILSLSHYTTLHMAFSQRTHQAWLSQAGPSFFPDK